MTEEDQPTQNQQKTNQSEIKFPGILLRLILAVVTGTIIGVLIYFTAAGWIPYLDQRIFQPIDKNQADIDFLMETQHAQELLFFNYQEQIANLQSTLEMFELNLDERADNITSILATVDANTMMLLQHTQSISSLEASIESTNRELAGLATAQSQYFRIHLDLSLLKIIDLLSLANQHLLHANYGQAENELFLAGKELSKLQANSFDQNQSFISAIMDLVDGGITDLPENYSLASEKIQLARQMALQGFPDPKTGTSTLTPNPSPSHTQTPES